MEEVCSTTINFHSICAGFQRRQLTVGIKLLTSAMSTSSVPPVFETLAVSQPAEYVYHVELNRPEKRNAMNDKFWRF